jgi:hypothetical protein
MKKITTLIAALLFCLTISAQNSITTDSILQLSTCAGGNVVVPFSTTGTFPFGNNFIAQLSNNLGQFTNPVNIGQTPFNLGFIFATIPQNTNFGFLYKIRVISTNPAVTGTPCPNILIITQIALLNQIIAFPDDTICQGDSTTLTVLNPVASYLWSTGDTTQSITVGQSGVYTVTTTDFMTCQSDTSISILVEVCTGINENTLSNSLNLYPNPSTGKINIECPEFGDISVSLYNLVGRRLLYHEFKENKEEIDINSLPSGMYIIKVSGSDWEAQRKVVKE